MAGESKRLAVLIALTTYLASEITIANGYKHDLNEKSVLRGRGRVDVDDPLPCISLIESPNPDRFPNRAGEQDNNEAVQRDNWTLLFQGWAKDDKEHPTDPAYELMADLKKALAKIKRERPEFGVPMYPDIYMLGKLIIGLEWEAGTVRPPEEQSSKAFFWMRVILKFSEDVNDPYKLT
jgi:hypothetical protein